MSRARNSIIPRSILLLACACVPLGCTHGCRQRHTVKEKIEKTIQELEAHAPDSLSLAALRKATPQSLETPQITSACLAESLKRVDMAIRWIEAAPTVDAICVRYSEAEAWQTHAIGDYDQREVDQDSDRGFVSFTVSWSWERGSESWIAIRDRARAGSGQVAFSRNGQIVSNIVSLKYICDPRLVDE